MRLSGPAADRALEALLRGPLPEPRRAALRALWDGTGDLLDRALVLRLPGPGSFTGENVVELHLHGSPAVVTAVAEALATLPGLRPAEPGEFSRRAFANDRLDLTAAEGLADLIDAETAEQRRQALRQMGGALADLYDGWRRELIRACALAEAAIDFPDEDLPTGLGDDLAAAIDGLDNAIAAHMADGRRGERLRSGLQVAIVGAPNAGKSSLLNRLAGREAAIVSEIAGTTRDIVEVHLDLAGWPVLLADTAGLRDAGDVVEAEGVRRARLRAEDADLRIALFDAAVLAARGPDTATAALVDTRTLVLASKADLPHGKLPVQVNGCPVSAISAASETGLEVLVGQIAAAAESQMNAGAEPALTRPRHRAALMACRQALARARQAELVELAAEDLRLAARDIGRITGRVDVEDVLDQVFSSFCIGK